MQLFLFDLSGSFGHVGISRYLEGIATASEKSSLWRPYYLEMHGLRCNENGNDHTYLDPDRLKLDLMLKNHCKEKDTSFLFSDDFGALSTQILNEVSLYFVPFSSRPLSKLFLDLFPKMRYVLMVHDLIWLRYPEYFCPEANFLFRSLLKKHIENPSIFFLCNSLCTKQDLIDFMEIDEKRIYITPLAADKDVFYPRSSLVDLEEVLRRYNIPLKSYFLVVSRYIERKNIHYALELFAAFMQEHPQSDAHLVIVGTALGSDPEDYLPHLVDYVIAQNISDRVSFLGYVEDEELASLYTHAKALIFTSFYEGFGLTPLECLQCGGVVICGRHSGLIESVGSSGILLDLDDKNGWLEAMKKVFFDEAFALEKRHQALEQAAKFSWESTFEMMEGIFDDLMCKQDYLAIK